GPGLGARISLSSPSPSTSFSNRALAVDGVTSWEESADRPRPQDARMRALTFLIGSACAGLVASASGQESRLGPPTKAAVAAGQTTAPGDTASDSKHYDEQVRPFFARHCLACHGGEKPKRDLRLDRLAPDFADAASRERWMAARKRLQAGEMPPKVKPRPPEKEVRLLIDWIGVCAEAARVDRRAERPVVMRRLKRDE